MLGWYRRLMRGVALAVMLTVALVACERAPVVPDDRIALLERLHGIVTTTPRHRSPVEPALAYTNAIVALGVAYGHARLGNAAQARRLADEGARALSDDDVHRWIAGAYRARIEQAIAGTSRHAPLPVAVLAELDALDRVARYKVEALREHSRILEPTRRLDALGGFSVHWKVEPQLVPLRVMERAIEARSRGADLVPFAHELALELGAANSLDLPWLVERTLHVFPKRDLAPIVVALERYATTTNPALRAWLAAAWHGTGDVARARPVLAETRAALANVMESDRVEMLCALAATTDRDRLADLATEIAHVTDSWGTSSHVTRSVVVVSEALVLALVD